MKKSLRSALKREAKGVAYVLPAFILLAAFTLYPMIDSVITSLYNWNMTGKKKYIAFYNYKKLFSSQEIWQVIGNTMQYVLYVLPATLILGFIVAMLLRKPTKHNVFFRTLIFTPRVTSLVGLSTIWLFIYNPSYGVLNYILNLVGLKPLRWVNETSTALMSLSIITVWRMLGYSVVVYLGGIQNVSTDVQEAATIDGANRIQTAWHVVMPLVSPTTFMLLILNTIEIMKLFTTIENMTGGGPANSTANLVILLYEYAFRRYQIGYASAIALVLFVLILIINLIQLSCERFVHYDI